MGLKNKSFASPSPNVRDLKWSPKTSKTTTSSNSREVSFAETTEISSKTGLDKKNRSFDLDSFSDFENSKRVESSIEFYPGSYLELSELAQRIFRTHFSKKALKLLKWLAENHREGSSNSASHVSKLLNLILEYSDKYYSDPFSSFLLALYDSLSFEDNWINLPSTSYSEIQKIITKANDQVQDFDKADKFISKLENLGLNTLPF